MDKKKYQEMRETVDGALDWYERAGSAEAASAYALRIQAVQARALVDIAQSLARLAEAVDDVWESGPALITHAR